MMTLFLRSLRANLVALLAALLAVALGTSLIVGTIAFTEAASRSMSERFVSPRRDVDLVVEVPLTAQYAKYWSQLDRPRLPIALRDVVAAVPGVRATRGETMGYAQLVDRDGQLLLGRDGSPSWGRAWLGAPWSAYTLQEGRAPQRPDEVVADAYLASSGGFALGDTVQVVHAKGVARFRLVGVAQIGGEPGSTDGGALFVTPERAVQLGGTPGAYHAILVQGDTSVPQEQLAMQVRAALGAMPVRVQTGAEAAATDQSTALLIVEDLLRVLALFAVVGLLASSVVISNAFSLNWEQRKQLFALLRTIGASPRQILALALGEALGVALLGGVLGYGLGIGVAVVMQLAFAANGLAPDGLPLSLTSIPAALLASITLALLAVGLPARRAANTSPLAAFGAAEIDVTTLPRWRRWSGYLLAAGGAMVMLGAVLTPGGGPLLGTLGALGALAASLVLLGPPLLRVLAGPLGTLIRALFRRVGPLAHANVARTPRRQSLATSMLALALAGSTLLVIVVRSFQAGYGEAAARLVTAEHVIYRPLQSPGFAPQLRDAARRVPGVAVVAPVYETAVAVEGAVGEGNAWAVDPTTVSAVSDFGVVEGSFDALDTHSIAVHSSFAAQNGWRLGDQIPVVLPDGSVQQLRMVARYANSESIARYLISHDLLLAHTPSRLISALYIRQLPGADTNAVANALRSVVAAAPGAVYQSRDEHARERRGWVAQDIFFLNTLVGMVLGVALLGVINTTTTLIAARQHEFRLLRLVGATRAQTMALVLAEMLIVGGVGVGLGLGLGVLGGTALAVSLPRFFSFELPWATVLLLGGAGLLCCMLAAVVSARLALRSERLQAPGA
jgi:putative ABC transport system permease protein